MAINDDAWDKRVKPVPRNAWMTLKSVLHLLLDRLFRNRGLHMA